MNDTGMHLSTVYAVDKETMSLARKNILSEVDVKVKQAEKEHESACQCVEEAIAGSISTKSFVRLRSKSLKRLVYLRKVRNAVEAGYLPMPRTWDVEWIAIRTDRKRPRKDSKNYDSSFEQSARPLARGSGSWHSPFPTVDTKKVSKQIQGKDGSPQFVERNVYFPVEFTDIEVPAQLANPVLIRSLSRAKKEKIFDRIGACGIRRKGDPFLVGEVIDTSAAYRSMMFFMAWWLDCDTI